MNISRPPLHDTDPIPFIPLNHWSNCPRRCGLIDTEEEYAGRLHAARGMAYYARADAERHEALGGRRAETALPGGQIGSDG